MGPCPPLSASSSSCLRASLSKISLSDCWEDKRSLLSVVWALICRLQRNIFLRSTIAYSALGSPELQTNNSGGCILFCQILELLHIFWSPLFSGVSGGGKRSQILNSSYLAYCFGKLGRIQVPLVTFGWSFGDSDRHLVDAIAGAVKVRNIFVGVIGRPRDQRNASLIRNLEYLLDRRRGTSGYREGQHGLEISFYDSQSAAPWG
ncbi:MAG: DUF4917 family protein [Bdellovibrionota bacterium]